MKIFVIDISARSFAQYNPSLCRALSDLDNHNEVYLLSTSIKDDNPNYHVKRLIRLVPSALAGTENPFKRILRALEVFINYIYISILILKNKPGVAHFQWLPFVEVSWIESLFLKLYRRINKEIKIFLTVHNVYPHDLKDISKYKKNFLKVSKELDGYFVHLNSTRTVFHQEFNIPLEKIFVSYHGIYNHTPIKEGSDNNGIVKIVLYGLQKWYKGTDIFVEALESLPKEYLKKCNSTIVGVTDPDLYNRYISISHSLNVNWINAYVSDNELNRIIEESSLILLPYRKISQSGVLLLALSYMKPILTSDLDSFKETLDGYPSDYFFKSEDPHSLAQLIIRFINGDINIERMNHIIRDLNKKYSWEETAKSTLSAYNLTN